MVLRKTNRNLGKCPKSPDGKHEWTPINRFVDKCIFCGETTESFTALNE